MASSNGSDGTPEPDLEGERVSGSPTAEFTIPQPLVPEFDMAEATQLANAHRLRSVGTRPPFIDYVRHVWRRRSFAFTLAMARSVTRQDHTALGSVWLVINPALLVLSYYLIFGVLLGTKRGVENFIGFLCIGLFVFTFAVSGMLAGSRAINENLSLVRSLWFPRALLPLSTIAREFFNALPSLLLLLLVMPITGEPITWHWLLYPVALFLIFVMSLGLSFLTSRLLTASADIGNLFPVAVRLLRYVSGVFFAISNVSDPLLGAVLHYQPFALALDICRQALMESVPFRLLDWVVMSGWALLALVVGFIYFFRAESTYGRVS